jgi:molybdopterin-guanine dinucleotide biosynthesis protein A
MVERKFECRGFVLCGGHSRRMNTASDEAREAANDKALLPFGGRPLAVHIAERVKSVCGNATLVGPRTRYAHLGLPIVEDIYPEAGPMGGLHAALSNSHGAWSLVVACDMPNVTCDFLQLLARIARHTSADAVIPAARPSGFEPLCGLYSAACLPDVENDLRAEHYKLLRFLETLQGQGRLRLVTHQEWLPYDPQGRLFWNVNTPREYQEARKVVDGVSGKARA